MSAKKYHWMFSDLKYSNNLNLYCDMFCKGEKPFACIRRNPFRAGGRDTKPYICTFCEKLQFETKFLKSTTLQDAKKEVEALVIERLAKRIISLRNEIEETEMVIEDFRQGADNGKQ
ncbi:hypothetical protein DXD51_10465 [Eubacterium sp. TM05-53]|nr:hypothetical protein DXD51_10465 [Eubacterium sp. TM05-53]